VPPRFFQAPQPGQYQQLAQSCFPPGHHQACDFLHDPPDRIVLVPQSRQDRNHIIPDFLAFEQPVAVQLAYIDRAVPEPHIRPAEFTIHSKRGFPHVEQHLAWESLELAKHAETVFSHAQRHGGIVSALQFQVDQDLLRGLTEEVHPGVSHLREFDIQPLFNGGAGQLAHRELGRASQQQLQGYVVFLHGSLPV